MSPPLYGRLIATWRHGRWCHCCGKGPCFYSTRGPTGSLLVLTVVGVSVLEFCRIYERLDIEKLVSRGESFYQSRMAGIVKQLDEKGTCALYRDRSFLCYCPFQVFLVLLTFPSYSLFFGVLMPWILRRTSKRREYLNCKFLRENFNVAKFATISCAKLKTLQSLRMPQTSNPRKF